MLGHVRVVVGDLPGSVLPEQMLPGWERLILGGGQGDAHLGVVTADVDLLDLYGDRAGTGEQVDHVLRVLALRNPLAYTRRQHVVRLVYLAVRGVIPVILDRLLGQRGLVGIGEADGPAPRGTECKGKKRARRQVFQQGTPRN